MHAQKITGTAKTELRPLGVFTLILLVAVSVTSASYQGPPPGYSQQPPPQYHQQGGQDPYASHPQQGYAPHGQQYPQQPRPGQQYSVTPYGQRYDQQGSGGAGGFFSKLKSSILAAGSAIAGSDGVGPESQGQPLRKPAGPPQYGALQRPNPQGPGGNRPPGYGPSPQHGGQQRPGMGNQNEEGGGLMSKLKNFFASGDEGSTEGPRRPNPPGPPGSHTGAKNSRTGSPPGFSQRPQQGLGNPQHQPPQPPSPYGGIQHGYTGGYPFDDPFATPPPPHLSQQQQQHQQQQFAPQQPPPHPWGDEPMVQDIHPQSYGQQPEPLYPSPSEQQGFGYEHQGTQSHYGTQQQDQVYPPMYSDPFTPPPPMPEPPSLQISPEPQVFVVEDCIVLIPRPQEFYKKKSEISAIGSQGLQVFSDYERCLSKFKTDDGDRVQSTAELLESSSVLMPNALQRIRGIIENFASMGAEGATYEAEERYTAERESVIAREGQLHMGNIAPATRDMIPRMPLRDGWKDIFHTLAYKGVPTYIFSDGYGDVVQQALVQGGSFDNAMLPQNVRIISNMFRTAPDGTVRAFSQPIVHCRNKNVTTAAQVMGFPLPNRPYALLIGAHENDLNMLAGIEGLKDKIALGFLEMTTDLVERLPHFLRSYDVVVLGDGSLQYAKTLVEELLDSTGLGGARVVAPASNKAKPFQGDFFVY